MKTLLTTIGNMGAYRELEYRLSSPQSEIWKGKVAGIAEAVLFGPFSRLLVFYTKETKKWFQEFKTICAENEIVSPTGFTIPSARTAREQWHIVDIIIDAVLSDHQNNDDSPRITLDITHGYRTLPLLYFTAISFLTSFHSSVLEQVLYTQVDCQSGVGNILDVTSSFEVIKWYHATSMFAKSGRVRDLLSLVERRKHELRESGVDFQDLEPIRKALSGLTTSLGVGLPIELGNLAYGVQKQLQTIQQSPTSLPLFKHLLGELKDIATESAIELPNNKESLDLTEEEILRQERIIRRAMEYGQIANALTMLREFYLNRVLLDFAPQQWLRRETRHYIASQLNALVKKNQNSELSRSLSDKQHRAGCIWDELTQTRNRVAHCGFSHDLIDVNKLGDKTEELFSAVLNSELSGLFSSNQNPRTLLICPLGKSRGAMYSAIKHIDPSHLLAILSPASLPLFPEVLQKTGLSLEDATTLVLDDPHSSFDQLESIVREYQGLLIDFSNVAIHLVGGTTLMGELARAFGRRAKSFGIPGVVFASVDRRPHEDQLEHPYKIGEYIETDSWPDIEINRV